MNTGLILVDIQRDYFSGGRMELVGMKEASENARVILQFFRKKKMADFSYPTHRHQRRRHVFSAE